MRSRPAVQMVVFGTIASAAGIALGLIIDWFPVQASSQAKKIDTLYDVLIIASVPMFVLVLTVVLFSVRNFRMRPGQEEMDGPPIHGSTKLEVVWTAIPAILMVGLCTYAYVVLRDIERKPANAAVPELKVQVYGQQFAWSYSYPKQMTGGKEVMTDTLVLPKGRSVEFHLHAKDVIHDFFVPAFRLKQDAVPGITTHYRVTPIRLGSYPVVCAELCGLGHSVMRSSVTVVTPQAFGAWIRRLGGPTVAPAGAGPAQLAAAGKQIFTGGAGCGGCHTLADAGTSGTIGPNLGVILKGRDANFIHQSIVSPNAFIAKGFPQGVMPQNFGQTLSPTDIKALVAYLRQAAGR